jgi:phenylpropionate dioxygenase-like ring-hydroxylating dioxygenase large terminal subunit
VKLSLLLLLRQVEERGGFIWLFWGDKRLPAEERPPIPFTPELEDPTWHAVYVSPSCTCGCL